MNPRHRRGGFTLIELVVTLTLVSVLALVAVPLYEVTVTRAKESELRTALRQIRTALDAYKFATDNGTIAKDAVGSGYPPNLLVLVQGVDTVAAPLTGSSFGSAPGVSVNGAPGFSSGNAPVAQPAATDTGGTNSGSVNAIPTRMVFLRQVPRDPFFEDQSVAPELQWNLRAYGAPPGDFSGGEDVYDVSTKSTAVGLNGIAYKDW
jgi:general secretion pathway protein G